VETIGRGARTGAQNRERGEKAHRRETSRGKKQETAFLMHGAKIALFAHAIGSIWKRLEKMSSGRRMPDLWECTRRGNC